MIPTPRSYTSSSIKAKPTLEIIPDTRFIVFYGSEHEASNVKLTGRIRFTTPESMSIMKPKVRLEGKRKISWWYMGGISAGEVVDKRVFWNQEQKVGIESSHKVKAGTIEWPFEFELSPTMPESVEGLRETYIVYNLHASVSRPGWNAKDIVAQSHIRIVRTLGQDSMEMTRSRVNADIWANKISYSISIPTDAIVFGTSITADVELSPLKKGLRLGKVELRLIETVVRRIQASEVPDVRGDRSKTEELEVAKSDLDFPENTRVTYENETPDNPTLADEMYKFRATLPLPKSLNNCRQDVDSHQINVTHRFKLMVNIHNPEGHVSQLVCRLPVKLFISPNLPVDDENRVCASMNGATDLELNQAETAVIAPPEYGRHQLDQMYSDIDPSGFMSRAGSASGTPSGPFAQSRRASFDNLASLSNGNLASLNGIADSDVPVASSSAHPHASILHSRLADLQSQGQTAPITRSPGLFAGHSVSGGNSPNGLSGQHSPERYAVNTYFPNGISSNTSPHASNSVSGRTSDEILTNGTSDYDISTLSRVPSYGAATRTPGAVTPFTDGPPTYFEATSRPPSPQPQSNHSFGGSSLPRAASHPMPGLSSSLSSLSMTSINNSTIQRPSMAYMRNSGTSTPSSTGSQQTLTSGLTSGGVHGHIDDAESRLRILRAART
ncbi:Hypothetical protein R9X50_00140000 [Acrodontium crateriforme]|uniref:Arrestin C-terminal-like domain-containing protein n=1 Tax=Acrodontium crateriforme TaxID=150365 RepID=A0AAQ3LZN9_9PEZI|nr:Hypothetical protein R9X50_00140000 [Acrodontium crateriforme]